MVSVIKNKTEYHDALERIEFLIDSGASDNSTQADELEVLALLVENYESTAFQRSLPNPIEAIKFRMDQQNLSQRDLIPYMGSRSKVSEVLAGKRPLTLSMIRALHENLGIPANVLVQDHDISVLKKPDVEWKNFPVKEIVKRGWVVVAGRNPREHAEELMREFFLQLGNTGVSQALFRKSDHVRSARAMDEYALNAWTARVIIKSRENRPKDRFKSGLINSEFMQTVAKLSWSEQGPLLAQEFLFNNGISLVIEPHLPRTHLDGAAILVESDHPVIGLSLRYDRIDNFWYCLLHELAHIGLHLDGTVTRFYDDLDVEDLGDVREEEADLFACEALIPMAKWEVSPAKSFRSAASATQLANQIGVHPAIVAGRMRRHFNNYKILSQLVGHGQVRKLFSDVKWSIK